MKKLPLFLYWFEDQMVVYIREAIAEAFEAGRLDAIQEHTAEQKQTYKSTFRRWNKDRRTGDRG